ncbi:hypothetical protein SAMN05216188_1127 [Lentzea xinjiangensis]|uniref:Uncharacterized protein n=1 Tax=Lentzea xinjiangensis TaxID=402600 RepID=A0A1H9PQ43_9PSEU|nr:hypothetical protein [Lentzea xinjiangensis]SER49683.1 hypothetical protein SAMN05216188_1127 [Lentzea xinjiangensis]
MTESAPRGEHEDAALALLESLSDDTLAEITDLLVAGRPMWAVKLAYESSRPDYSLSAAIQAIGLFEG